MIGKIIFISCVLLATELASAQIEKTIVNQFYQAQEFNIEESISFVMIDKITKELKNDDLRFGSVVNGFPIVGFFTQDDEIHYLHQQTISATRRLRGQIEIITAGAFDEDQIQIMRAYNSKIYDPAAHAIILAVEETGNQSYMVYFQLGGSASENLNLIISLDVPQWAFRYFSLIAQFCDPTCQKCIQSAEKCTQCENDQEIYLNSQQLCYCSNQFLPVSLNPLKCMSRANYPKNFPGECLILQKNFFSKVDLETDFIQLDDNQFVLRTYLKNAQMYQEDCFRSNSGANSKFQVKACASTIGVLDGSNCQVVQWDSDMGYFDIELNFSEVENLSLSKELVLEQSTRDEQIEKQFVRYSIRFKINFVSLENGDRMNLRSYSFKTSLMSNKISEISRNTIQQVQISEDDQPSEFLVQVTTVGKLFEDIYCMKPATKNFRLGKGFSLQIEISDQFLPHAIKFKSIYLQYQTINSQIKRIGLPVINEQSSYSWRVCGTSMPQIVQIFPLNILISPFLFFRLLVQMIKTQHTNRFQEFRWSSKRNCFYKNSIFLKGFRIVPNQIYLN